METLVSAHADACPWRGATFGDAAAEKRDFVTSAEEALSRALWQEQEQRRREEAKRAALDGAGEMALRDRPGF